MDFFKFFTSENLMILNVKIAYVCDVMPKGPVGTYRRLGGTYWLFTCCGDRENKHILNVGTYLTELGASPPKRMLFYPFFIFSYFPPPFRSPIFQLVPLNLYPLFFPILILFSCFFSLYKSVNPKIVNFISEKVNLRGISKRHFFCV
jgi:hypothetical protein